MEETSAGGLVVDGVDGEPRAALIGRLDRRGRLRWSLPKGHVEAGETNEDAAVREVAEETGITGRVRRAAGHDRLLVRRRGPPDPQDGPPLPACSRSGGELSDEDIEVEQVEWVPLDELADRLAYDDERRLVEQVPALLADTA